jgi:hypothetical protein
MVTDREKDSRKTSVTQGSRDGAPDPNKIGASRRYDFNGKNLTPYGGLLPMITMLEKLDFQTLVEQTATSKRIPPTRSDIDMRSSRMMLNSKPIPFSRKLGSVRGVESLKNCGDPHSSVSQSGTLSLQPLGPYWARRFRQSFRANSDRFFGCVGRIIPPSAASDEHGFPMTSSLHHLSVEAAFPRPPVETTKHAAGVTHSRKLQWASVDRSIESIALEVRQLLVGL